MQSVLCFAVLLPALVLSARPRQSIQLDANYQGYDSQILTYRQATIQQEAIQASVAFNCRAGEKNNLYEITVRAVDSLPRSEQSRLDIKNNQGVPHGSDVGTGVLRVSGPYSDLTETKNSADCAGNGIDGQCAIELTGVAEIKQYVQVPGSVPGSLNWVGNYRIAFTCRLDPESPPPENISGTDGNFNLTVCNDFKHTLIISPLNEQMAAREALRSQKVVMNTQGTPYGVMWNNCHLETSEVVPGYSVPTISRYQIMRNGVVLRSSVAEVSGRSVDTPGEKYQMDIENLTLEGHVKIVCEVKKCQNGSTKFESANLEACPEGDLPQTTGTRAGYSLRSRSMKSLIEDPNMDSRAGTCALRAVIGQL